MVEYFYSVTDEKQSLNAGAHENKNYCFEHKPLYKKEMAEFDFYTPTAEKQEMIDQYLARTDAEYRARNRANIDSSVKRFNAELVEKYGAENLNPEDFLVIPKEGYHDGLFEKYFRACIDRVEKKFQNKQIHINQESAFLPVVMNDALREMLAHPDYSECIASFIASINKHSSDTKGESKPNTTDHFNGDTNNSLPQSTHSPREQRPEFANNPKCDGNEHASISVISSFTDYAITSNISYCCPHSSTHSPMRCAVESRGYLQESHLKELVHCNAEHFPQTMFAHKDPSGSLRGQSPELIMKGGKNLSSHTESMDKNRQIMGMMSMTSGTQGTGTSCGMVLAIQGNNKIFVDDMGIQVRHHDEDKCSLTFEGPNIGNIIKSFVSSISVPVVLRSMLLSSGGTHIHRISANPYISVSTQSLKHHMAEWLYLCWRHMRIKRKMSLIFGSIVVKSKTLTVPSSLDYSLFHHISKIVNDTLGSKKLSTLTNLFYSRTVNHVHLRLWINNG
ncbi:6827_t:CDS:2 [Rhizophagus irregularis]|nr:6827_t:CDS:2 [Rhizophagus irregularis]